MSRVRISSSARRTLSRQRFFGILLTRWIGREARQRPAKPYTRVRIPYPPPTWSNTQVWAIGAAVARFPDTEEVTGSIPVSPTERNPRETGGFLVLLAPTGSKMRLRGV